MEIKSLIKKVLVLFFLSVVLIVVLTFQEGGAGRSYVGWIKEKITGLGPELNLAEEESGLDLKNIDINNLFDKEKESSQNNQEILETESQDGQENIKTIIKKEVVEKETEPVLMKTKNLSDIEKELKQISLEVKKISNNIKEMAALNEIQKNINDISNKIAELNRELGNKT